MDLYLRAKHHAPDRSLTGNELNQRKITQYGAPVTLYCSGRLFFKHTPVSNSRHADPAHPAPYKFSVGTVARRLHFDLLERLSDF